MITQQNVQFTIGPPSLGIPKWFSDLPQGQWVTPVGTNRIQDVVPPPPYPSNYTTDDITGAGNGAGVDQILKWMCIGAVGGHSGWWGSDCYGLDCGLDTAPVWVRLVNFLPTYNADIEMLTRKPTDVSPVYIPDMYEEWGMIQEVDYGFGFSPQRGNMVWIGPDGLSYARDDWPTTLVDGESTGQRFHWKPWNTPDVDAIMDRPRPGHTCWAIHFYNGKMWYPITWGSNNGSGRGSHVPHSFDVTFLRNFLASSGNRYTYEFGNKVPYKYYPSVDSGIVVSTFGTSAMDTATGRMWTQAANGGSFFYLDAGVGKEGNRKVFTLPFGAQSRFVNAPNQICPDAGRRMWVAVSGIANALVPPNEIIVYDLDLLEASGAASSTNVLKILVPGLDLLPWNRLRTPEEGRKGYGMIWHRNSKAFIFFNCDESPRDATTTTLFRLHPPLDANGNWIKNGAWSVSQRVVPGIPAMQSSPNPAGITGSSFSRFNQIEDMGNGETLFISQGNVLNPPSFMRVIGAF